MSALARQIVISGAGPSGLAAALLFHQRGWEDIVVVERRISPTAFDRGKAFNYQIDPRGQQLLERLGIQHMLHDYGLPNNDFTLTFVKPDGKCKTIKPPIIDPDRGTAFWTRRNDFLRLLQDAVDAANTDKRIRLLYGHQVIGVDASDGGRPTVLVEDQNGDPEVYQPQLLLGCDGLHSAVRGAMQSTFDAASFAMVEHPSPANELAYKVLNFPAQFSVNADIGEIDDHSTAFAFTSTYSGTNSAFALFALPVASAETPRSINLIRGKDHEVWDQTSGEALLSYLETALPQLSIRKLVPAQEANEFAELTPGEFPTPQYCKRNYAKWGTGEHTMLAMLIGDAAHSFPPDLGLGVNSALEDLFYYDKILSACDDDLVAAGERYQDERAPEGAALVRLVQTVHPYQYNQKPWRLKLWSVGFMVRLLFNKLLPQVFDKPAFMLTHDHTMPYQEVELRKQRTDFRIRAVGVTALLGLIVIFIF